MTFLSVASYTVYADPAESISAPLNVVIRLIIVEDGRRLVEVAGVFTKSRRPEFQRSFSLSNQAASSGSTRPIEKLTFRNGSGNEITYKELAPREYLAAEPIRSWSYVIELSRLSDTRASAHASWVSGDVGVLMMRDLWPPTADDDDHAIINVKVPEGWGVSGEKIPAPDIFPLPEVSREGDWFRGSSNSVFFVGRNWLRLRIREKPDIDLHLSGIWHFSDTEAADMVREVYSKYEKIFGHPGNVTESIQVGILRFPGNVRAGEWQAETRGRSVTIVSSDMPFKTQSLQRLHEQVRHELFHLWIPNDVNLTGNYDWFFEGFALYQSLKLAVGINRIRFEDFLDTLSRAHTIDSAFTQRPSLIGASKNRFSGLNTQVYARGMLVAFLTDIALMGKSGDSVDHLLRKLYTKHRKPASPVDGNEAVIGLMTSNPSLEPIVNAYVKGKETISWKSELAVAGIEDIDAGPITTLKVKEKPSSRQKALLDKLGYNNWRKLPQSPK